MKIYWYEQEKGKKWRMVMTPKAIICNVELLKLNVYLLSCLGESKTVECGSVEDAKMLCKQFVKEVITSLLQQLS